MRIEVYHQKVMDLEPFIRDRLPVSNGKLHLSLSTCPLNHSKQAQHLNGLLGLLFVRARATNKNTQRHL